MWVATVCYPYCMLVSEDDVLFASAKPVVNILKELGLTWKFIVKLIHKIN